MGTLRVARRARAARVRARPWRSRPLSPRSSWTWPSSVNSRPAAGLESEKISRPQPCLGQVAAVLGEAGDLGRAHHRVEHAAEERDEPRALPAADVAGDGEHAGDQFGAANRAGVDRLFRFFRRGPAFGQVGLAERVLVQPLLADGVGQDAVHDAAPPGEIVGCRRAAVQAHGQGVEHVADHGTVVERADRERGPLQPGQRPPFVVVGGPGVVVLVEVLAQREPEHVRVRAPGQVAGEHGKRDAEAFQDRYPALGGDVLPRRRDEFAGVV